MKKDCDVILDLLPLYHDKVCSKKSRELVEEHLKECASCRQTLDQIQKEISLQNLSMKDAGKAWRTLTRNLWLRRAAATMLIIALTLTAVLVCKEVYEWDQERMHFVDPEEIIVSNLCRLSDGRIYLEISSDKHNLMFTDFAETGEPFATEHVGSHLISGYWSKGTDLWEQWPTHWTVVEPSRETGGFVDGKPVRFIAEDIVLTDWDHTEEILVCRFDDELPPASAEIEAKAAERDELFGSLRNG